ncbi:MAG: hypothetical protein IKN63_03610 [Bacilli bacterium]|nr:hypothetical protein [Bacilli bacterium]
MKNETNYVKKYLKYGIILIIVIGLFMGLKYLLVPSMDSQIKEYLKDLGYIIGDYDDLLVKNVDDKKYTFSLGDYSYTLERDNFDDSLEKSLTATYNYKNESMVYSYRVYYSDSINVYFKGTYNNDNFACEKEFSSASLSEDEEENICSLAKIDIEMFKLEAETLFTKYKFIDYIKNR